MSSTRNVALGQPTVGEEEIEALREVFASGWLSGAGPTCVAFEKEFAVTAGTAHALATSNCGSALHLALQVLGAGPGDEVIVADYTFPATGHAVVWTGATPIFADVRPDIGTIDVDAAAALVTERTVGIIAVDLVGQPADYDELAALARKHGLWLLEDAACSAGATYKGRPAGSLADLAAFSFHGRKGITSGEGGALVGDDTDLMDRARKLHTYGIAPAVSREGQSALAVPEFDTAGYNYRMSDVQAAIMRVQLRRLPDLLANRTRAAEGYAERLAGVEGISLPVLLDDRTHPWQSYLVTAQDGVDRDRVVMALRERGVGSNIGTYSSHVQPVYGATRDCPVAARLFRTQFALPMHANLTDDDLDHVAEQLREVLAAAEVRTSA
ncbi:pyridoxal phosphate-dependent aminotransferase [Nocardioides gansuensis]|uniref:Pyridoxal phosphate-dependent aminotransferase n=1 Tax=Nocardioides gansuensis TaxID=2138300 RepID=A0A2T8F6P4_9ACTN|nr:DegT/DnrJ/EryC1/StrS family aminotransferase [Nocardioides gansuensis]PVG81369.1 pyridoxal phosphate-dependent aminotransferase [Nocardioides gansuensis]